jgi:hypothetical protein
MLSVIMPSFIMLSVKCSVCHAEHHNAECHYVERHNIEYHYVDHDYAACHYVKIVIMLSANFERHNSECM